MGGRKDTDDELWARAEANGYKRGAHVEEDQVRDADKYISTTKENHERTLAHYLRWQTRQLRDDRERKGLPPIDEAAARRHFLGQGVPAPDLATVKDFLRFYAATGKGKIDKKSNKITADSLCSVGEWFFAGHARVTGSESTAADRSEVYYWARRTLVREGVVVNKHRAKHNFGLKDLNRVNLTEWTCDDLIYIHPRNRVQSTWLRHVYCWTGARINTFFKGGIRYKDVDLVLQRVEGSKSSRDWRIIYKLDQRFVKNNRDPEDVAFGAAAKEDGRLFYNDAGFLLVLALADGALEGYRTFDDLREQVIPADRDEVPLRFKQEVLNLPIARKCTKSGGVTNDPMSKSQFEAIFRSSLINAGYNWSPQIHAIRRQVGKGLDRRYTAVERSQHLLQNDTRVFGQSYVANCSSVDGQAAFRGEESDHRHVEYFQGLEKFHENGLPTRLPAHLEKDLDQDAHLCDLKAEVQRLRAEGCNREFSAAQRRLTTYSTKLKKDALDLYRECWIQERRDWIVQTRGKEQADNESKTDLAPSIYKLFPERGRLAQAMASTSVLSVDEMWAALQDLLTLCLRDVDVLYLPGSRPVDGECPICRRRMNSLPKCQRNQHIQTCVRQDLANHHERLLSDVNYCYFCFDWVVGEKWEPHCRAHLKPPIAKRCGTVTHCHTLMRPGYCPLCVACDSLPPSERLKPWTRDHFLWKHVEDEHFSKCLWPLVCCDSPHEDPTSCEFHLVDVHRFSRSRPSRAPDSVRPHAADGGGLSDGGVDGARSCRKRKSPTDSRAVEWQPPYSVDSMAAALEKSSSDGVLKQRQEDSVSSFVCPLRSGEQAAAASAERLSGHPRKRTRPSIPTRTICPEVIVLDKDVSDGHVFPNVNSTRQLSPAPVSLDDDDDSTDLEGDQISSCCTTVDSLISSHKSAETEDNTDWDIMFDQYLRSPSLSPVPSPHDTASQLSGATLIEAKRNRRAGIADLSMDTSGLELVGPIPEPLPEKPQFEDQQDKGHRKSGPRLRLRVSQPRITLRLKLPAAPVSRTKAKRSEKKQATKRATKRGRRGKARKGK